MVESAADLQQLKGVGKVLAKRLYDAGYDSFAKIAQAGEEGLQKVRGINPRTVTTILEQARQLSKAAPAGTEQADQAMKQRLTEVRGKIQSLAELARDRHQEQMSGRIGKKLSADLVRIENALERMGEGAKRAKRAGKALLKAEKRVTGLEEASLKKIRKRLKRARKAVQKAL